MKRDVRRILELVKKRPRTWLGLVAATGLEKYYVWDLMLQLLASRQVMWDYDGLIPGSEFPL